MSTNETQSSEPADGDHGASAYEAVLVFDGECPLCSAAATALRRLPEVGVVAWDSDGAQRFLGAQFDEPPFALVFVDGTADRLWLGRAAAGELCGRAGVPTLVRDVVADNFERIAGTARDVAGGGREPADLDGTRSLSAAGAAEYRTLATSARSTHGTGESRETARTDTEDTVYASL